MRLAPIVAATVLLGGCQTMQSLDAPKAEVASAARAWADAFNRCDPPRISALYDQKAVLWGTNSPNVISTPEGVRTYFDAVCASPTPPKVEFGEQLIRVHGETAINSGAYTFLVTREGKTVPVAARYTISTRKQYHRMQDRPTILFRFRLRTCGSA